VRPFPTKSRFFALLLLLVFLASSTPSLAISKTPYSGVSPLKAGHSNRIECNNNPVNAVDPEGLRPTGRRGTPHFNRYRTRRARGTMRAQAEAARAANLESLGLQNLDLRGKTLERGANALYRRGFRLDKIDISGNNRELAQPYDSCTAGSWGRFWHFSNPSTGTRVIWDRGNSASTFNETARPHWTIQQGNRHFDGFGNSVPKHSGSAHIRSGGSGQSLPPIIRQGESLPGGFPAPPFGNDGFFNIGPRN